MIKNINKYQIATLIAILFHLIGFIGIVVCKNNFIINSSAFNLLLMFFLLIWTHPKKNIAFYIFVFCIYILGFLVEAIGVNTSFLFGNYKYENTLGQKFLNVPLIIGVNWFIIIYCCGIFINTILLKLIKKIAEQKSLPPNSLKSISIIVDGATLAVFCDWLLEPVAIKLKYWQWQENIPMYNYFCWFIFAALFLFLFQVLHFNKQNKFAIHLMMIQLMFFLLIRVCLI